MIRRGPQLAHLLAEERSSRRRSRPQLRRRAQPLVVRFLLLVLAVAVVVPASAAAATKNDDHHPYDPAPFTAVGLRHPRRLVDVLRIRNYYQQGTTTTTRTNHEKMTTRNSNSTRTATTASNSDNNNNNNNDVQTLYFTQRLDHFRGGDARTFDQRYFASDRYVRRHNHTATTTNVAFVCVGGEGPDLDPSVLIDSVHCTGDLLETARRLYEQDDNESLSIHLYALEHRYYGASYPANFDNEGDPYASAVTNEHLVYLSSRQAVADLAHFVSRVAKKTAETKVVLFGGSYPGMLAAWTRRLNPHVVRAAVSNSAPVQAVLDFAAYHEHVADDLQNAELGGSAQPVLTSAGVESQPSAHE